MYKKWKHDLDKEFKAVMWLECETVMECGRKMVRALKCSICSKYKSSSRNFSDKWIVGVESLHTNTIQDHGKNNQQRARNVTASKRTCYQPSFDVCSNCTSFNKIVERLGRKFDIAYLVATESMSFLKYPVIYELEKKRGLDIGNECSGRTFVHYITEARRQELAKKVVSANFYFLLIDGSTDKGNIYNEAVLAVWCDSNCSDEKVHTRISYLGQSLLQERAYLKLYSKHSAN